MVPNVPSKSTCLKLLKIHSTYHFLVAAVAKIINWEDVISKCKLTHLNVRLCSLSRYFHGRFSGVILKDHDRNDPALIHNENTKLISSEEDFYYRYSWPVSDNLSHYFGHSGEAERLIPNNFLSPRIVKEIDDMRVLTLIDHQESEWLWDEEPWVDGYCFISLLTWLCPMEYNLIIYEDTQSLFFEPKNISEGTASANILKSIFVIKNQTAFPFNICQAATLNLLVNDFYDQQLVKKFPPFWLYSYRITSNVISEKLSVDFEDLKYNVGVALCLGGCRNGLYIYTKHNFEPDIDLLQFSYNSNAKGVYEDIITKAKVHGFIYKHLDFENEKILEVTEKIDEKDLNKYFEVEEEVSFDNIGRFLARSSPYFRLEAECFS